MLKFKTVIMLFSFIGSISGYGSPPPPPPPPCNTPQCPSGTFCYSNTNQCTPCPPGYRYNSNPNVGVSSTEFGGCTICPEGSYSVIQNSAVCTPCEVGTYTSFKGSTKCSNCLSHEFNDITGQSSCSPCLNCPTSKYTLTECNIKENTKCASCSIIENCANDPTCSSSSNSKCSKCISDYFLLTSSNCATCKNCINAIEYETKTCSLTSDRECSTCTNTCPPGMMLTGSCSGTSNPVCVSCSTGFYKLLDDNSECLPCINKCNSGFELDNTCSAITNSICLPCKNEFYKSLENDNSKCLPCTSTCDVGHELNHNCLSTINPICIPCKDGFYKSLANDNSKCLPCTSTCDAGHELNHACLPTINPICIPCKDGFYKSLANDGSMCLPCTSTCDAGHELNHACLPTINPICIPCKDGFYKSLTNDKSMCLPCNNDCGEGSYLDTLCTKIHNPTCILCPENTANPHKYSVFKESCIPCNTGSISVAGSASCIQCSKGTATFGSNECIQCLVGTYTDNIGSIECKMCKAGTYNQNIGSLTINDCIPCEPGYYSNSGSQECIHCPIGTYDDNNNKCISCPMGTYNNLIGQTECINCNAGTANNNINSIDINDCITCPKGSFSNNGSVFCNLCLAGTSSDKLGAEFCVINDLGTYTPSNGSLYPINCAPGNYSDIHGATICKSCKAGYMNNNFGSINENECVICVKGSYSNTTSSTFCYETPIGTYQDKEGQTEPIQCLEGTYNNMIGSTTQNACLLCDAGKYQSLPGSFSCENCNPGYYQNNTGQIKCLECPAGTYNEKYGQSNYTSCIHCIEGTYSSIIAADVISTCIVSPFGSFVVNSGSTNYTVCDPGFYQNKTSQTKCISCAAGKYNPLYGSINHDVCIHSPIGHYVNNSGSGIYHQCETGSSNNITGSTYCDKCLPGTYTDKNASLNCDICSYNAFTIGSGYSDCNKIGSPFIYSQNITSHQIDIIIKTNFTSLFPLKYTCSETCEIYINNNLILDKNSVEIDDNNIEREIFINIKLGIDIISIFYNGTFNTNFVIINDWACNNNSNVNYCTGIPINIVIEQITLITNRLEDNNIYANPNITYSSKISIPSNTQDYKFSLINLEPSVKYNIQIEFNVINNALPYKPYDLGVVITNPGIPSGPIQNLVKYFIGITPNEHILNEQSKLKIHWDLPKVIHQHGPIINYNISYTQLERKYITYGPDANIIIVPSITTTFFTNLTTILLTNLNPDTNYIINVYPLTIANIEGPVNTIHLKTSVSAPPKPPALNFITNKDNDIIVSWPSLTNETGTITKVWIISEPYLINEITPMVVHIPLNSTGLTPLPFPHTNIKGFFGHYNILNTCENHIFGFTFISFNSGKICGGFCDNICEYGTEMLDPTIVFPTNDKKLENDNYIMLFNNTNGVISKRLVPYLTMKKRNDLTILNNELQTFGTFLLGDGLINIKSKLNNTLLNKNINYRLRFIVFTSETLYSISEPLDIKHTETSTVSFTTSIYIALIFGILLFIFCIFCIFCYKTQKQRHIKDVENMENMENKPKNKSLYDIPEKQYIQSLSNPSYWISHQSQQSQQIQQIQQPQQSLSNPLYWNSHQSQQKDGFTSPLNNPLYLDVSTPSSIIPDKYYVDVDTNTNEFSPPLPDKQNKSQTSTYLDLSENAPPLPIKDKDRENKYIYIP